MKFKALCSLIYLVVLVQGKQEREKKFFSLLALVGLDGKWSCTGDNGDSGFCSSDYICRRNNGAASGYCASGFGVCCILSETCGGTISRNCSYFTNENYPEFQTSADEECIARVEQINDGICQLRLDFETFDIRQPDSDGSTYEIGECGFDSFTVAGSQRKVPIICGNNDGQHMYVEFSYSSPIKLIFRLMGSYSRQWKIKLSQIACKAHWKAPTGCLQYFTEESGHISTFNANGRIHLLNHAYSICIRPGVDRCTVSYTEDPDGFFSLSDPAALSENDPASCIEDILYIPGGSPTGNFNEAAATAFCGGVLNPEANQAIPVAVRSTLKPFLVHVVLNSFENAGENGEGFLLNYSQEGEC